MYLPRSLSLSKLDRVWEQADPPAGRRGLGDHPLGREHEGAVDQGGVPGHLELLVTRLPEMPGNYYGSVLGFINNNNPILLANQS